MRKTNIALFILVFTMSAIALPAYARFGGVAKDALKLQYEGRMHDTLTFDEQKDRMLSNKERAKEHMQNMLKQLNSGEMQQKIQEHLRIMNEMISKIQAANNAEELKQVREEMHEQMKLHMGTMHNGFGHGKMMNRFQQKPSMMKQNKFQNN
jgi:uncharacterized protein with von Willebrand factor type A (vWA) domain